MEFLKQPETISNILLHVAVMVVFLNIFFFTYGRRVEKEVVNNQMDLLAKSLAEDLSVLPGPVRVSIAESLANINGNNMREADRAAERNNQALVHKAFKYSIWFVLAVGAVVYLIWRQSGRAFSVKQLLKENAILILAVAFTEFMFATFVLKNYRSVDPNKIRKEIVQQTRKYGRSCKVPFPLPTM